MKYNDFCPYCDGLIEFDEPMDYWENEEDEALGGIICPHCGVQLVLYYTTSVTFNLREAGEKDKKELEFCNPK